MTPVDKDLYTVKESDIQKAGQVLAAAFEHDPIWEQVLAGCSTDQRNGWFESPVRYCMKFGHAIASSPEIEGFIGWLSGENAEMTFPRMLRSGATGSGMRAGFKVMKRMMPLRVFDVHRRKHMKGRQFIYVMVVGVAPEFQGRGIGGKLIRSVLKEADKAGLPVYLETSTESNAAMYVHLGFKIIDKITVPKMNIVQWELLREPK